MTNLNETLRAGDLRNTIKKVFSIDSHKSKIGDDSSIVVLNFVVDTKDAADDLENFIEMGYDFVLDADSSAGETDEGLYSVFVELERTRHSSEQILEIIEGIKKLADLDGMRFRYFKSFKSYDTSLDNLELMVPINKKEYESATEKNRLDNFSEFFSNSYADEIKLLDESISFKRTYSGTVIFDVVNSGSKKDIYDSIKGPIVLETKNMAEVMFLTKVIGNYSINKIGDTFIFENNGWAVALKRKA
jgi:hypothetical protein